MKKLLLVFTIILIPCLLIKASVTMETNTLVALGSSSEKKFIKIAATNSHFLITFWLPASKKLKGLLLTKTGVSIGSPFVIINSLSGGAYKLAASQTKFVVIFNHNGNLSSQKISNSGTLQGSPTPITNQYSYYNIASNGHSFMVVWQNTFTTDMADIHGQALDQNGNITGPKRKIAEYPKDQAYPRIGAAGSTYLVAWLDRRFSPERRIGQRLYSLGAKKGPTFTINTDGSGFFKITGSADRFFLAGFKRTGQNNGLYGYIFTENGTPIETGFPIRKSTTLKQQGSATFIGGKFIATWQEGATIRYRIIDTDGSLPNNTKTIQTPANNPISPSLAATPDGTHGILTHIDTPKIYYNLLTLYDDQPPKVSDMTFVHGGGETRTYFNLRDILKMKHEDVSLMTADIKDTTGGAAENKGILKVFLCMSRQPVDDQERWNDLCDATDTRVVQTSLPYPTTLADQNITSIGHQGYFYEPFRLPDGENFVSIRALDGETVNGGNPGFKSKVRVLDQYAPCDDYYNHSCGLKIFQNKKFRELPSNNPLDTAVINNLDFVMELTISEGGSGQGIQGDGLNDNLRFIIAKQEGDLLQTESGVLDVTSDGAIGSANNLKDRACNVAGQMLVNGSTQAFPQGLFHGVGPWNGHLGVSQVWQYQKNMLTSMRLEAGETNGSGQSVKAAMENLLGTCGSSVCDGTIYIMVCVKDRAGNWSRLIDKTDTKLVHSNSQPGYTGYTPQKTLAEYDPIGSNYNKAGTAIQGEVPSLTKRIYYDGPAADSGCSPATDPCPVEALTPPPPYLRNSEKSKPVYIAFSPAAFTGATSITAGVKLPPDSSGIAGLYFRLGSKPSGPKNGQFLAKDDWVPCNNVNSVNDQNPSGTWTDACFNIEAQTSQNLYVWLVDNAGNIGFGNDGAATRKRKLFVDAVPPTAPGNLRLGVDPVADKKPELHWDHSIDDSGIGQYKVCLWPQNEAVNNQYLSDPQNNFYGRCPSASELAVGEHQTFELMVPYNGVDTGKFQWPEGLAPLPNGRYSATVIGFDGAENPSPHAGLLTVLITDGRATIDFTLETKDYAAGGVSPLDPSLVTGNNYTFKIRYTDFLENGPIRAELWIDKNGDGRYGAGEILTMAREGAGEPAAVEPINLANADETTIKEYKKKLALNGKFYDGEDFITQVEIPYPRRSRGTVQYKFLFTNSYGSVLDGPETGNPIIDNRFAVSSRHHNFNGFLEIRNNVQKARTRKPVVFMMKEPQSKNKKISLWVINLETRQTFKLIRNEKWRRSKHWAMQWRLRTRGRRIPNGRYKVIYMFAGGKDISDLFVLK